MTANKDEPEKKPAGPASAPAAGARPHATLDLKATDVTPPAGPTAKDKPDAAEASAKTRPTTASSTSAGASASAASAASPGAPPASSKSDKPGAAAPPSGTRPTPRGSGGFFTHLAAGLAGGIIALLAADMLAGQLGFETDQPDKTAAIEQRLNALEAARSQRGSASDLGPRLVAAEAKLGKLEQLDANLEGVSKKQAEFDKDINALNEKVASGSGDADASTRVAKLEEQLSLLSSTAAGDPQSGRLPQLAAITGKLADLESTLSTQLDAVRKNVSQEIDTRLASATEAGQAARSGTQRIDRELSRLKAESAETSAGLTALKTDSDRAMAALKTTQEDLKRLKGDLDTRLAAFAKPEDVSSAVAPIGSRLAALQQDVQGVIKSEGDRRTTAERIVLSLELANLKRAIERGKPYGPELAQTRKVAGSIVDLAPLDRFALDGVPTATQLRAEFKPVAFKIIDAEQQPTDASIVDRLLAGAKSVVRVRKTAPSADDKSIEAVVARMEAALNEDRLADVLEQGKSLPPAAQDAARDFLAKVEARDSVDRALASVESQLKDSLAAAPAGNGNAAQ